MARGIPAVGVARGGIAELIDPSNGKLAAPGNAHHLAAAIAGLYENDLAQLGRNARCKMLRQFKWEQVVDNLLEVYTHLSARGATDLRLLTNTAHAIKRPTSPVRVDSRRRAQHLGRMQTTNPRRSPSHRHTAHASRGAELSPLRRARSKY